MIEVGLSFGKVGAQTDNTISVLTNTHFCASFNTLDSILFLHPFFGFHSVPRKYLNHNGGERGTELDMIILQPSENCWNVKIGK